MVIGFDASRAFASRRTGTENYSFQLLKHLSLLDHTNNYNIFLRPEGQKSDISLQSSDSLIADRSPRRVSTGDSVALGNRPILTTDSFWPSNFHFKTLPYPKFWTQLGLALETFKTPLDVLFVPSHTLPIIHKPGLKTMLTVHDLGAEYLPQTHQLKQRLYLNLMTHHQLKTATHLIAVSEATKADIIKRVGIPPEKITVVYEGFDEKLYKIPKTDVLHNTLKQYELQLNSYFLFVGTIQPRKNLERLIRAYALFISERLRRTQRSREPEDQQTRDSDIPRFRSSGSPSHSEFSDYILPKLVLVGNKGWLSDEIYELPKKLGIENQVKFLGFVPDQDLPALYSGAQALLFPSLFEGFGLPILEAMACGCPVITSNLGSMKEIVTIQKDSEELRIPEAQRIRDSDIRKFRSSGSPSHSESFRYSAILVDPYSTESISEALVNISKDNNLRSNLVKLGSQQVKKFSWEKAAKETLEILEKVSKTH